MSDAPSGRTVLITGSTSGIGMSLARAFAADGDRVLVHGLEEDTGHRLASELGGRFVRGDLSDPRGVRDLAAQAAQEVRLDVLVNNAGFERPAPLIDLDADDLTRCLQVNLVAPAQLIRLLVPRLRMSGSGSVVNISSMHDSVPVRGNSAYAMSKAGMSMLTRSAAIELAGHRIRVNAVAPGAIETPMNSDVLDLVGRASFESWIPTGRLGSPDDLAGAVLFLTSAAASYITGSTLVIDGGYSHHLVRYPG